MEYVEQDEHSLLSASDSARWHHCHGALFMTADMDRGSSKYAREGTAAHRLAATALTYHKDASAYIGRIFEVEGQEFEVDAEMASAVQVYLDRLEEYRTVPDTAPEMGLLLPAHVEVQVNYSDRLGVPREKAWGTSDAIVIDENAKLIQVHDLKYGQGERVDAVENTQGICYALGVLDLYDLVIDMSGWEVLIVIHQPRLHHFSEWRLTVDELRNWGVRLSVSARKALDMYEGRAEPVLTPGAKQCRWCPFAAQCPAATQAVLDVALVGFNDETDAGNAQVRPVAAHDLARHAALLPFVRDWCKNVATALDVAVLHEGKHVPGFKAVRGKAGNRKWTDEAAVIAALTDAGVPQAVIFEPAPLKSPAVLEKEPSLRERQGRKVVPSPALVRVMEMVSQAPGNLTVVPESDPRPAESIDPTAGFSNEE